MIPLIYEQRHCCRKSTAAKRNRDTRSVAKNVGMDDNYDLDEMWGEGLIKERASDVKTMKKNQQHLFRRLFISTETQGFESYIYY
jgi:hypothetical protein